MGRQLHVICQIDAERLSLMGERTRTIVIPNSIQELLGSAMTCSDTARWRVGRDALVWPCLQLDEVFDVTRLLQCEICRL